METIIKKNQDEVYADVVLKSDGSIGYAYTDDKVYDGVVVINAYDKSIIRASDDKLYVLWRTGLPLGKEVRIAIRQRPSRLDNTYLKPMRMQRFVVSGESELKARIICRLNKDILFCRLMRKDEFWGVTVEDEIFVECSTEDQAKYAKKADTLPCRCANFFAAESQKDEVICIIPVVKTNEEASIPACLQKSNRKKGL